MAFRFTLQPVLRLRQGLEERERQRLLLVNSLLAERRRELDDLKQARILAASSLAEAMQAGMVGSEFHFQTTSIVTQGRREEIAMRQVAELERQCLEQQAAYREAQKQRKILENLRDRQLASWRLDQARREQQRLDDLFMLRQRRSTDFPRQ